MEQEPEEVLHDFEQRSKSGVGIHMFELYKPGTDSIFVGSEVTDDNNVLNAVYQEWSREYIRDESTESKLKPAWKPIHTYGNGRAFLAAVLAQLRQGYQIKDLKP